MYDGASLSEPARLQRAVGELRIGVKRRGPETVLDDLRQAGCLKARFPRRVVPGWMDIVMLNTGGGVAAGDRLDIAVNVGPGAQATIAAQAAERFYRARTGDPPSHVRTHLTAAIGAALEWLPQETILFDQSALNRRLEVDLAADARFLGVETIVFGRTAMGERIGQGTLRDLIRITRDGELLLHDAIRIEGDIDAKLQRRTIAAGAGVVSTIVYVAQDTAEKLTALRASPVTSSDRQGGSPSPPRAVAGRPCTPCRTECAASAWNDMLVVRILGPESAAVRRTVIAALAILRANRPLPRVWLC
jgi:urease accessory protein